MPENEVKLIVTAIDNTKVAFAGIQNSLKSISGKSEELKTNWLATTTATNQVSKAFKQLGTSLHELSFIPIIGDVANMGSIMSSSAGSLKNFTAALKNIGGVSVTTLGPAGMAGAAGLAAIAGYALGKAIDSWTYKLTGVDISGLNQLKDTMKSIKEEAEAMAPRIEKSMKEIANLGIMPGATWAQSMQRFNEAAKEGKIIFDEVSKKWITASETASKAMEKLKEATIKAMESQKATLNGQLSNLKTYYSSLEKLHNNYIENIKAKNQELLETENSARDSKLETSSMVSSVKQRGMSSKDVYEEKTKQLGEQEFQAWIMKPGDERINVLKKIQQEWSNLTDEVREGENVVVSSWDAQRTAMEKVKSIGDQIVWAMEDKKKLIEGEKQSYESMAVSLSTAMQAAKASILDLTNQIAQVDMALAKEKKIDINVNQAFDNIKKVREMIDSIPDVTTKKVIIETFTKSSPAMPFSEGIEYMKEQLGSLPTGANFTVDMSSMTGLMKQFADLGSLMADQANLYRVLKTHYAATPVGLGTRIGATRSYADTLQNMMKNLFNVEMVQTFSNIFSQLHGHEKIDSMLQDLIEGYLGNIKSFQGLTSPIEFTKPSVIQVHTGEKLYPASDNSKSIFNSTIHIHDTEGKDGRTLAKEMDKEFADMWRTGRSRLKRVMQ